MRTPLERVFVKPADGLLCRSPASEGGALLPTVGLEVRLTQYWIRRLKDGDVVRADAPVEVIPAAEAVIEDPKPAGAKRRAAKEE